MTKLVEMLTGGPSNGRTYLLIYRWEEASKSKTKWNMISHGVVFLRFAFPYETAPRILSGFRPGQRKEISSNKERKSLVIASSAATPPFQLDLSSSKKSCYICHSRSFSGIHFYFIYFLFIFFSFIFYSFLFFLAVSLSIKSVDSQSESFARLVYRSAPFSG